MVNPRDIAAEHRTRRRKEEEEEDDLESIIQKLIGDCYW